MMLSIPAWWRDATQEKLAGQLIIANLICLIGLTMAVWWMAGRIPPEYPLFYSLPPGGEQLAKGDAVWQAVASVGVMGVIDTLLGWLVINKWRTLGYIILWSGLLSTLLLGYSLVRIYLLVV